MFGSIEFFTAEVFVCRKCWAVSYEQTTESILKEMVGLKPKLPDPT